MAVANDERAGRELRSRLRGQASIQKRVGELVQAVFAGGVGLEGPRDVWCPLWIRCHSADLVPVVELADVQVADRGPARLSALLGLLAHPLHDLGRQVLAVELRDRTHDPVQQHPGRRLVDVLRHGHELSPGSTDDHVDFDVV